MLLSRVAVLATGSRGLRLLRLLGIDCQQAWGRYVILYSGWRM